ncbi:MAG TPA: UvrD-helicase domain-containing protein, partial [Spirochaetia bacterium]
MATLVNGKGTVYHRHGMPDLEPDTTIELPSVTVLKASAGSGKTWALTERYAQFLLSRRIRNNDLRNILAITFSNNASREMRAKVLEWLKRLSFRDPARLAEIAAVIEGGEERASARATSLVDEILDRFSDFQVQTIDSFMSTIFRASALDFGYAADFEIVMDATPLVDYAFTLFVREAEEGSDRARLLDETIQAILGLKGSDDSFPWEPTGPLLGELQGIESRLSSLELHAAGNDGAIGHAAAGDGRATPDGRAAPDGRASALRRAEDAVRAAVEEVDRLVRSSGLERSKSSTFPDVLESVRAGRFTDLVGKGMKASPVKKPAAKDAAGLAAWEAVGTAWAEAAEAKAAYTAAWGRSFFEPYLRFHESLSGTVERVKRSQGKVAIGDIGRELGRYIANDIVPDVYFRLGERIWHFLIDEFQDTSPVQWRALFPLVENSLAMGGSLFVVGDTKQAIYGFRQADFRIMKGLEEESPFASADRTLRELTTNRRSGAAVLDLVADVFRRAAPSLDAYREAARRSGLDSWTQVPAPGARAGRVGVEILARDDEDPPEKERLCALMEELH